MFDAGRAAAAALGVELEWVEADAEALPFPDGAFDVVLSCLGIMFAPHHRPAADEALRVCRAGGRIGLLSWTPDGFVGELFRTMAAYAPPPLPGVQPPPLWGDEDHVRALLGDRVIVVAAQRRTLTVDRFRTPAEWLDYFRIKYGPMVAVYRNLAADPERVAALDEALTSLAARHDRGGATLVMEWEYLVLTARTTP